jgi:PIN domain nuclease of toxin-antitoxin system
MVRLEMQYLFEIARVAAPASTVLDELTVKIGLRICDAPFLQVVQEAERQPWTRDPFDRLIVAQASLHGAVLITKDDTIAENYAHTIWDKPQSPEISSDA